MKVIILCLFPIVLFSQKESIPNKPDDKLSVAVAESVYRNLSRAKDAQQALDAARKNLSDAQSAATAECVAKNAVLVEQEDGLHCVAKPEPKTEEKK